MAPEGQRRLSRLTMAQPAPPTAPRPGQGVVDGGQFSAELLGAFGAVCSDPKSAFSADITEAATYSPRALVGVRIYLMCRLTPGCPAGLDKEKLPCGGGGYDGELRSPCACPGVLLPNIASESVAQSLCPARLQAYKHTDSVK